VNAIRAGDRWNAEVRIRDTSVDAKPRIEHATYF